MAITRKEVLHVARWRACDAGRRGRSSRRTALRDPRLCEAARSARHPDVVPTSHAIETGTPFRDDVVEPFGQGGAPRERSDRQNDFPRPRIIED